MNPASSPLGNASVRRVQAALAAAGSRSQVLTLSETARTAQDAANAIGCELGAIVKSLVFRIDGQIDGQIDDCAVLALVAGDRRCDTKVLPEVLNMAGKCKRADADLVRLATGFAIGGVAPLGHPDPLAAALDSSLSRFDVLYAAAGHPHCVFPTTFDELLELTKGISSDQVAII